MKDRFWVVRVRHIIKRPVSLDKEWTSSIFLHRDVCVDCSKHSCTDNTARLCHCLTHWHNCLGFTDVEPPLTLYFNESSWSQTCRFTVEPESVPLVLHMAAVKNMAAVFLKWTLSIICAPASKPLIGFWFWREHVCGQIDSLQTLYSKFFLCLIFSKMDTNFEFKSEKVYFSVEVLSIILLYLARKTWDPMTHFELRNQSKNLLLKQFSYHLPLSQK